MLNEDTMFCMEKPMFGHLFDKKIDFKTTEFQNQSPPPTAMIQPTFHFMAVCPGNNAADVETFLIKASGHKAIEFILGDRGHTKALVYPVTKTTIKAIREKLIKISATLCSHGDYSDGNCMGYKYVPSVSDAMLVDLDQDLPRPSRNLSQSTPRYLVFEDTFLG